MVHQVLSEKNKTKFENTAFLRNSVNFKEITWIRIWNHFFPSADPGSGSASKLNGS